MGRGRLPSLQNENTDKIIQRNLKRVAMTWLDEHSAYFENSMGSLKQVGWEHFSSNKMINFKQVFLHEIFYE